MLKLVCLRRAAGGTRLGLAVSRRAGNAVVRNRIKRVLREAFRLDREDLPPGLDVIVIPLDPARARDFHLARASLVGLLARAATDPRLPRRDP